MKANVTNKVGRPLQGLIDDLYIPMFHKQGEAVIPILVKSKISQMCFMAAYRNLPPIDKMPLDEKTEMKKYVNDSFKGETPQFRLMACKIIYTIGNLI